MNDDRAQRPSLAAAPARLGHGGIGVAGPLLATALLAAGVVLLRDALIAGGVLGGPELVPGLLRAADHLEPRTWMIAAGVLVALAGLALTVIAVLPRSRRNVTVSAGTGLVLRRRDVARLASDAAGEVGGVRNAWSSFGRRRVLTTVEATSTDSTLADEVRQAVATRLAALSSVPAVRVRVRGPRADRKGAI